MENVCLLAVGVLDDVENEKHFEYIIWIKITEN